MELLTFLIIVGYLGFYVVKLMFSLTLTIYLLLALKHSSTYATAETNTILIAFFYNIVKIFAIKRNDFVTKLSKQTSMSDLKVCMSVCHSTWILILICGSLRETILYKRTQNKQPIHSIAQNQININNAGKNFSRWEFN